MVWVGRRTALVGVFEGGPERYYQRHVTASLLHISSIEPLIADSRAAVLWDGCRRFRGDREVRAAAIRLDQSIICAPAGTAQG